MTSTSFLIASSSVFSSPGLHEDSIKKEHEKDRNSVASTIPRTSEEISEDGRSRGIWEKRKICLWVFLAFLVYVITLAFIFGITYASIKISEKSSLSKLEVMMTERSHPIQTKQKVDLPSLPLLWTLPLEKFQEITSIILEVSEVDRRMYRVSAAFRNYENNVTTMKFMTGEELWVSSEMGQLSDSKGVPIVDWNFTALEEPDITDEYFERNFTLSFPGGSFPPSETSYLNSTLVADDDVVDISNNNSSGSTAVEFLSPSSVPKPLFEGMDLPVYPLLREPNNSSALIENVPPTPFLGEALEEEKEEEGESSSSSSSRLVDESGEDMKMEDEKLVITGFPMPMASSRRLGTEGIK